MTPEQQLEQANYLFKKMSKLRMGMPSGPIVHTCLKMIMVEYIANKDPTFRGAIKYALQEFLTKLDQNS